MSVRYTDRAEQDLREIVAEQLLRGHSDPESFAMRLKLRIAVLAMFPDNGHPIPETSARNWSLHGTPLTVLYLPLTTGIDILRVLDRSRDHELDAASGEPESHAGTAHSSLPGAHR